MYEIFKGKLALSRALPVKHSYMNWICASGKGKGGGSILGGGRPGCTLHGRGGHGEFPAAPPPVQPSHRFSGVRLVPWLYPVPLGAPGHTAVTSRETPSCILATLHLDSIVCPYPMF